MEIKKVISKSKDGKRMEVIATDGNFLNTLHVHQHSRDWKYCAGYEKGRIILRSTKKN